jgi:hypothetical protein
MGRERGERGLHDGPAIAGMWWLGSGVGVYAWSCGLDKVRRGEVRMMLRIGSVA